MVIKPKEVPYYRIFGGNIAYQKEKVLYYGKFDPKLGRTANEQLTHEERLLLYNMQQNKEVLYYHPEMILYHFIPEERATYKYLVDRAIGAGKSGATLDSISDYKHKNTLKTFLRDLFFFITIINRLETKKKYSIMCSIRMIYMISFLVNTIKLYFKK